MGRGVTSTLVLEDGQASGSGGVNTFRGSYESPADGELTFSPPASTRMAGPEVAMAQEAAFLKALEQTKRFELDGDRLVLGNAGNDTLRRRCGVLPGSSQKGPERPVRGSRQLRSKRSSSMTLAQAAAKSLTNFVDASSLA